MIRGGRAHLIAIMNRNTRLFPLEVFLEQSEEPFVSLER